MPLKFFNISPKTKILILIITILTVSGLTISYFYYGNINEKEDPRVLRVKRLQSRYNKAVIDNNMPEALDLISVMDSVYASVPHYTQSFERGVLETDRASVYLNMALYHTAGEEEKLEKLDIAEKCLNNSLSIYEGWKSRYSSLDENGVLESIRKDFSDLDQNIRNKILEKRVFDILEAQNEMDRRYSVTYTNLGVVMRHRLLQDSALYFYRKAIDLWDDNHAAKSNLNVLLGKEPLKRGALEKLFPPEKNEP
jgi:tetratricopeptide (TPR) repeat protein